MVNLINIHDYSHYPVYWEIRIDNDACCWGVRIYDKATGAVLEENEGGAMNEDEARTLSQQWVLDRIDAYKPEEVI